RTCPGEEGGALHQRRRVDEWEGRDDVARPVRRRRDRLRLDQRREPARLEQPERMPGLRRRVRDRRGRLREKEGELPARGRREGGPEERGGPRVRRPPGPGARTAARTFRSGTMRTT